MAASDTNRGSVNMRFSALGYEADSAVLRFFGLDFFPVPSDFGVGSFAVFAGALSLTSKFSSGLGAPFATGIGSMVSSAGGSGVGASADATSLADKSAGGGFV